MKNLLIILTAALGVIIIDQNIKSLFLQGYEYHNNCFSLIFALNKGVAFSMFEFLREYLKYIQVAMIFLLSIYLYFEQDMVEKYSPAIGIILGAGVSNIYDRFVEGGVVDYFYWHCGFDFAIFNFADVMIDLGVGIILLMTFLEYRREKKAKLEE